MVVLDKHNEIDKHSHSRNIRNSIEFGVCLINAKERHEAEGNRVPFYKWLEANNIIISKSHGNKLVQIAKLLRKYPKFKRLGIKFDELYRLRDDIKSMLEIEQYRTSWVEI